MNSFLFIRQRGLSIAAIGVTALALFSSMRLASAELEVLREGKPLRRADVLILSDRLTLENARTLQEALDDQITVSRWKNPLGSAEALKMALEGLSDKKFQVVLLDSSLPGLQAGSVGEGTVNDIAKAARKLSPIVLWAGQGQADSLSQKIREDLMREDQLIGSYDTVSDSPRDQVISAYPVGQMLSGSLVEVVRAALLRGSAPWAIPDLPHNPANLAANPDLLMKPEMLPQAAGDTYAIFNAKQGDWQFNMHPFLAHFEGRFWAMWSSGRVDEDSSSQLIRYATSPDGKTWSEPQILAPDPDGEDGPFLWMPGGLEVREGRLYAYGSLHKGTNKKGTHWQEARLHRLRWDGNDWIDEGSVASDTLIYFPPMKNPGGDGEIVVKRTSTAHIFTALWRVAENKWTERELPGYALPNYRMSETSHYIGPDGVIHLIIRDQGASGRLYHSVSVDRGKTWTVPVQTNYPDAVSKNFSKCLSNGWVVLINTPITRSDLVASFSRDGWTFRDPVILRRDPPPLKFKGKYKNEYSFNYSDGIEVDGKLWLIYSINKEDIAISSYDIEKLTAEPIR